MATMDAASWSVSITPGQVLRARRPGESRLLRRASRLLAAAGVAYAMTDPQIVAMLLADQQDLSQDGR